MAWTFETGRALISDPTPPPQEIGNTIQLYDNKSTSGDLDRRRIEIAEQTIQDKQDAQKLLGLMGVNEVEFNKDLNKLIDLIQQFDSLSGKRDYTYQEMVLDRIAHFRIDLISKYKLQNLWFIQLQNGHPTGHVNPASYSIIIREGEIIIWWDQNDREFIINKQWLVRVTSWAKKP